MVCRGGRLFRAAATGNAQSSRVDRRVNGIGIVGESVSVIVAQSINVMTCYLLIWPGQVDDDRVDGLLFSNTFNAQHN